MPNTLVPGTSMSIDQIDEILGLLNTQAATGSSSATDSPTAEGDPVQMISEVLYLQRQREELQRSIVDAVTPIQQEAVNLQQQAAMPQASGPDLDSLLGFTQTTEPGVYKRKNKGGSTEYTNVVDSQGRPTMESAPAPYAPLGAPASSAFVSREQQKLPMSVSALMQSMQAAGSIDDKISIFTRIQSAAAQEATNAYTRAFAQSSDKLGVNTLEQLLAQNEAADRAHPMWAQYQSDSEQTAKVRQQLESARTKAASLADSYLKQDPTLGAMSAQIKTAEMLLQKEYTADQRRETFDLEQKVRGQARMDEQSAREQARLEEKAYQDRLKAQATLEAIGAKGVARLKIVDPSLAGKEATEVARQIASGKTISDDTKLAIKATPHELLYLATKRNQAAAAILLEEEAATSSLSKEELGKKLSFVEQSMTPAMLRVALERRYPDTKSPEYREAAALLTKSKAGLTEEQQRKLDDQMFSMAVQNLQAANTNEWMGNLSKGWQWSDPKLQAAVAKIQETKQAPATLPELIRELQGSSDRKDWPAISEQLRKEIFANRKKGVLEATDADSVWQYTQQEFSRSLLGSYLGGALQFGTNLLVTQPVAAASDVVSRMFGTMPAEKPPGTPARDILMKPFQ